MEIYVLFSCKLCDCKCVYPLLGKFHPSEFQEEIYPSGFPNGACTSAYSWIQGRKRKAAENVQGVQDAGNYQGHESVHMGTKRRCRVHLTKKERKETVFGCKVCNVHLCKDGCHFAYHNGQ